MILASPSQVVNPFSRQRRQGYGLAAGGSESGFSGPLDAYEGDLFEAWSAARRLFASHTGNLVRLRRSSDNAESDFGFDADGELDAAAITTWKGAASLYLVTLYGQKGTANMTQATAGSQTPFNLTGGGPANKPYSGSGGDTKFAVTASFANYTGEDFTFGAVGDAEFSARGIAYTKNGAASRYDMLGNTGSSDTDAAFRLNGSFVNHTVAAAGWRVMTVVKSGNGANNIRLKSNDAGPTLGSNAVNMDIECYLSSYRKFAEVFAAHAALSTAAQDAIHAEMRTYFGL